MNKTTANIIVKIKILDQTGHSTLEQQIDDAIKTAFTYHFTNGKNINVRSQNGVRPFELQARDINDAEGLLKDTIRFHSILKEYEEPVIFITGALAGGTH
jgi:hypothetical protein